MLISIKCLAQSPEVNIIDDDGSRVNNAYYKDVDSVLNQFEGTYLYTSGNTSFKIIFTKKVLQYNGEFYEDLIIGAYQYIYNGVQISNTLSTIDTVYFNQRRHLINGNTIVNKNYRRWKCPSCGLEEKRLLTSIKDVISNKFADLIVRKINESGQEVIKINITNNSGGTYNEVEGPPPAFSLPIGEMTLIKQ